MARQQKRTAARSKSGRKAGQANARKPAPSEASASLEDRAIDAALEIAADRGWRAVSLAAVAEGAGVSLAQLYAVLPSTGAILDAFARRIDRATLTGVEIEAVDASTIRDRLFDVIMRSFDALEPHRRAVAALVSDLPRLPLLALCQGARLMRSLAWMAAAAGVDTAGPLGALRVKTLGAAYLVVLRTWLADESSDKAQTMAALDRALRNLEMVAQTPSFRRRAPTP